MANRIRGITIEIGGDTTKLNTALKKTDSQLKTTRTSLADVNRLLKLDPKNTVLLEQKQKNLASAISGTKTRLSELKRAEEQMRGKDLTEEQRREYEALQREIVSTETDLKRLEKQMRDFGSVGAQKIREAGKSVEDFGGKLQKAGGAISEAGQKLLPVTAAITGIAAASVKAWKDVDQGADTIVTLTGATGEALEEMRGIMNEISTEIPTDFDTAGKAIGEVNTRFDLQGDELKRLSRQYIEFADINKSDVVSSIDTTQKAMAAWNVATEDAAKYLDALTAASQKSGVKVETIAAQATTNAAALKELGFTASGAAMFLGQLEKNGVDASGAMAGLKKAYANALKDGTSLNQQLQDLEERLRNEETRAAAAAEAIELFGARSGGALAEAISSGRLSFEHLETSMDDFAGTVSTTFEATLDPLDNTKKVLNELKLTGAQLVESAAPLINDLLVKATKGVQDLSKWLGSLSEEERQVLIKTAAVAAAAGPLLSITGKAVTTVGKLTSGFGKVIKFLPKIATGAKAAGTALNTILSFGGGAVGVTAGLGAIVAGVAIWDSVHRKKVKAMVERTYGLTEAQKALNKQIQAGAEDMLQRDQARRSTYSGIESEIRYIRDLKEELVGLVDENGRVKEGYEDRAKVVAGTLADALGVEIGLTNNTIENYKELAGQLDNVIAKKRAEAYLTGSESDYAEAIKRIGAERDAYFAAMSTLDEMESRLRHFTPESFNGSMADYMQAYEQLKGEVAAAREEANLAAQQYFSTENLIRNYAQLKEAVESGSGIEEAIQRMSENFATAEYATKEMLDKQVEAYQEAYDNIADAVAKGRKGATQEQLAMAKEMLDAAKAESEKLAKAEGDAYAAGIRGTIPAVKVAGADLLESVRVSVKTDLGGEGEYTGSSYGLGLLRGLRAKEAEIRIVAGDIANSIPTITRNRLQVKSPSRIATWITENWDQGLINGLLDKADAVARTAQGVASGIVVSPPPASFTRYSETAADAQSAPIAAAQAPSSAAVNHVLGMILDRLYNLDVGIRNAGEFADGVTNYANRRLGRISALQESGVI